MYIMKKLYIKRVILIFLIIINCTVIFCFSAQQADESANTSGKFVDGIIKTLYKNKDIPNEKKIGIKETLTTFVRKGAHFSIYTCLGILTYLYTSTYSLSKKKKILFTIIFCLIYACSDEFHQMFVDGRSGEIRDVCIDTSGAIFGTAIVSLISKIVNLKNKK